MYNVTSGGSNPKHPNLNKSWRMKDTAGEVVDSQAHEDPCSNEGYGAMRIDMSNSYTVLGKEELLHSWLR